MKTLTKSELEKKARQYDYVNNEGGEGYNPYREQLKTIENEEYKATHKRDEYDILKELESCDCSIAKECGTYNQDKVDALRKELDDLRAEKENEFIAKWTPEYTQKIREEWNTAVRAYGNDRLKINKKIAEYQAIGIYLSNLKKAIKINNL